MDELNQSRKSLWWSRWIPREEWISLWIHNTFLFSSSFSFLYIRNYQPNHLGGIEWCFTMKEISWKDACNPFNTCLCTCMDCNSAEQLFNELETAMKHAMSLALLEKKISNQTCSTFLDVPTVGNIHRITFWFTFWKLRLFFLEILNRTRCLQRQESGFPKIFPSVGRRVSASKFTLYGMMIYSKILITLMIFLLLTQANNEIAGLASGYIVNDVLKFVRTVMKL